VTSAEPVRPPASTGLFGTSRVRAVDLASYQLVEDARGRAPEHVRKRKRERARNEQAVAARLVAREFERD
jgi:hypothetical protein